MIKQLKKKSNRVPYSQSTIGCRKGRCAFVSSNAPIENSALRGGCIGILPGQYYDQETELHYNYYRYYDPTTGRYITSDPIGLNGGLNAYGYGLQNPTLNIDPYGLAPWDFHGIGDTSACSYYDQLAAETGCDYYSDAAEICSGGRPDVNTVLRAGIVEAWLRGRTSESESEITTRIREGLIRYDRIARTLNNSNNGATRGDLIDLYHGMAFKDAGISPFFYGGNRWPQGVWPNPVPFDPIGNSPYDPRRLLIEADEQCGCQ